MDPLTYVAPGNTDSHQANRIYDAFIERLTAVTGGRAPSMFFRTAIPPRLIGKPFFFNDGVRPTPQSKKFPGYIARTASVLDPIYGANRDVEFARPYDHAPFLAAQAALVENVALRDNVKHIATVADAGAGYYTNGLTAVSRVSLWDHSLCAHWRNLVDPTTGLLTRYYLKETSAYNPERVHDLAVADIKIENLTDLVLPSDGDGNVCSKFCCLRLHNGSPFPCVTNLGTVPAYGIMTIRRDWDAATKTFTNYRYGTYFWRFESGDAPFFFAVPVQPERVSVPFVRTSLTAETAIAENHVATTPHGSLAANNLAHFGLMYDWALAFRSADFARIDFDVNEVCDLTQFRDSNNKVIAARKWDCLDEDTGAIKDNAVALSLVIHKGAYVRARVHRTQANPSVPSKKREDFTEFAFNGWSRPWVQIVAEFNAAGITLSEINDRARLSAAHPDWEIDIIQRTTNLLYGVLTPDRVAGSCDAGIFMTEHLFEYSSAGYQQDHLGVLPFGFTQRKSSYHVNQRYLATVALSTARYYRVPDADQTNDADGAGLKLITVTDATGIQKLGEFGALFNDVTPSGLHRLPIADLLKLKYNGTPGRESQDDEHVRYENVRLVLTPGGWRMLFRESVRADLLPNPVVQTVNSSEYLNTAGRRYDFNPLTQRWELDHCIRLRGHGWGYWEHGSHHALFHSANQPRQVGGIFTDEISGVDGADLSYNPNTTDLPTGFLRAVRPADLSVSNGSKVFKCAALDSLPAFERNYATPAWYQTATPGGPFLASPRERLLVGDRNADVAGNVNLFVRMNSEHVNGLIECVNQIVPTRVFDWRGMVFVQHTQVLRMDMDAVPENLQFSNANGLAPWWGSDSGTFGSGLPAPLGAFCHILPNVFSRQLADHWRAFFASVGIVERTQLDLPASWNEHRTMWNVDTTFTYTGLPGPGVPPGSLVFHQTTANHTQGRAALPFVSGALPTSYADLASYVGKKWIDGADLAAFFASVGVPFSEQREILPVNLDIYERPAAAISDFSPPYDQFAYPGTAYDANRPWTTKQIAFKLFGDGDAPGVDRPEWKLPVRTLGGLEMFQLPVGEQPEPATHGYSGDQRILYDFKMPEGGEGARRYRNFLRYLAGANRWFAAHRIGDGVKPYVIMPQPVWIRSEFDLTEELYSALLFRPSIAAPWPIGVDAGGHAIIEQPAVPGHIPRQLYRPAAVPTRILPTGELTLLKPSDRAARLIFGNDAPPA
jgi:hypothetical protein